MKEQLAKAGFILEEAMIPGILNDSFLKRYPDIPVEYLDFLLNMKSCVNANETIWFNSVDDFNGVNSEENAYAWNEFEIQSLDALDGDEEEQNAVRCFWDHHIPILISVEDGLYAYYSICVKGDDYGKVFSGSEPEYEEATLVTYSFAEFIDKLANNILNI